MIKSYELSLKFLPKLFFEIHQESISVCWLNLKLKFSFGKAKDNKKTNIDNFLTWRISFALKIF